jgi:hypothetical protein
LLVARGLKVGFRHNDEFAKLMAVGFAFVIALQVFVVIGGVTRILPLTGLTTPSWQQVVHRFLPTGSSSPCCLGFRTQQLIDKARCRFDD